MYVCIYICVYVCMHSKKDWHRDTNDEERKPMYFYIYIYIYAFMSFYVCTNDQD